ncbi:MAG: uracil-DNA glycosylase [Thaumarchaeota archaeon]|nr:uracil-DNA glycosylase [Nitrososphaerota archaeon]
MNQFEQLNCRITKCKKCPRLYQYIRDVAKNKVKRFQNEKYWGKPLTGFGDTNAELLLIGLAPAAHGGNRTGRMFTGDSSGDWLAKVLYRNGFSTKPTSVNKDDGFALINTYITATVRCAPPDNKPLKEESNNCSSFLEKELELLKNVRVIICLGRIAFDSCCKLLDIKGKKFSHGEMFTHGDFVIITSYHPSRQNTQTGRLSWEQWSHVFSIARKYVDEN